MNTTKRILIVGGVAGGASAAARARRLSEDAIIIMFERGEHISFANCGLPYHIGGTIGDRKQLLVQTPESFYKRFRIDVRTHTEVVSINREKKEVSARNLTSGEEYVESYDCMILSPGAEPVRPQMAMPLAGERRGFTAQVAPDRTCLIQWQLKCTFAQPSARRRHGGRANRPPRFGQEHGRKRPTPAALQ